MASREKVRQIDAQLPGLQPGLGRKNHNGERKMLYDLMADGENIERLEAFPAKKPRPGHRRGNRPPRVLPEQRPVQQ